MISPTEELLSNYHRKTGVQLVMVIDAGLNTSGVSNTSDDVSNQLDRSLLLHLRSLSDLAITDVATAIAENYRPSRLLPIEVWSKSGDFRGLVSIEPADDKLGLRLRTVEDTSVTLQNLLAESGSLLLETGATLTSQLASQELIDFAALTVTRASDENSALDALSAFSKQAGFDYLNLESHNWVDSTLFARFRR